MDVACLGARLILQTGLEAEVPEFLGRERDACGDRARPGSRNGSSDVTVTTTAGPVTLAQPKLRGTDEAFASRLLGRHVTHAGALASLTIAGYVRGLSTRDVEASLADALGAEAALSKSTVSRICEAIKTGFDSWAGAPPGRGRPRVPLPDLRLEVGCGCDERACRALRDRLTPSESRGCRGLRGGKGPGGERGSWGW